MKRLRWPWRRTKAEDGVELAAMLFVLPVLLVLLLALIDIGFMMRTRMLVENVARDGARGVAADGGNCWSRTNPGCTGSGSANAWGNRVRSQLWSDGSCTLSACDGAPTVNCRKIIRTNGSTYSGNVVNHSGEYVACTINYRYKGINEGLLKSPLGLGTGYLIQDFQIESTARAEVGSDG